MPPFRQLITVAALLSSACTQTLTQALSDLPRARPLVPVTAQDTVIAAALLEGLRTQFAHQSNVIIAQESGDLTAASLPHVDTLTFLLLTPEQIQQLADEYGDLSYFRISRPTVTDSVATVNIGIYGSYSRAVARWAIVDGPTSCEWRFVRHGGQWRIQGNTICLVS
jgi:hypothetical protein